MMDYPYRLLARWITADPEAWIALGNFETRLIARELPPLSAPLYICGMARSGTTIWTEALSRHPDVATHTYRDFPCLFTPYLWNRFLATFDWIPTRQSPRERAHQDGIQVTSRSPEAMEEMLWMAFFKNLHTEAVPAVLDSMTKNTERDRKFAAFYCAHIQKLLLARRKSRYVSKANYNLTRMAYLLNILPEARFAVIVRQPEAVIASCLAKDALFKAEQQRSPDTLTHMDQTGHFEFGLHRALIHSGDAAAMQSIQKCFAAGDDVRGWARYWTMLHRFIDAHCRPRPEALIMRHEDVTANPEEHVKAVLAHAQLSCAAAILHQCSAVFRPAASLPLPEEARAIIREETAETAALFGY